MNCPICKNFGELIFFKRYREYTLYHCLNCDVIFSHPMRSAREGWYDEIAFLNEGPLRWSHRQALLDLKLYSCGKRILDIGCGRGSFLSEAEKNGYIVYGLDLSKKNVEFAKKICSSKDIYSMSLDKFSKDFLGEKFDIITLFEVLEHIDNPIDFICQIKVLLRRGGYIALSLPNRNRFLDPLKDCDYPPNHLTKWSKDSLIKFLERNGFEIVNCLVNRFGLEEISLYLSSKIRFGIAKNLFNRGLRLKRECDIRKGLFLLNIKKKIFEGISLFLFPFFSIFPLEGIYIYCLARLKLS